MSYLPRRRRRRRRRSCHESLTTAGSPSPLVSDPLPTLSLMSPSWDRLWPTIPMWTSVKWGMMSVIMTVFSVTLTCCSGAQGPHCGDWFFPNENRLLFSMDVGDIYEYRDAQRVELRHRNNASGPTGIYCCSIAVNGYHLLQGIVYVGLYTSDGGRRANYFW